MNKLISNFDLPDIQNDDFLFFSLLTNKKIVCYIANDIPNEKNYIYIKKVKLTNDEYNGFIIQLKLLNIKFNHKNEFYVVYTINENKNYLNYNETYLLSSIVLFKTSLNYCKILYEKYHSLNKDNLNILINFSRYILKCIEYIDIVNINVLSSCILFLYGIRNFNDIDLNIKYEYSTNFKTPHFKKIMGNIGEIFKKKYNMDIDIAYSFEHKNLTKVSPDYNQFLKWYKNDELAKILYNSRYNNNTLKHFNAKSESKIVYDPSNYFYFLGVKFVSIEYEMYRRYESLITRNSWNTCHSKRFSELIYLIKQKLVNNVTIPFYEKEFTYECFLNTQKIYKEQFNEDISIKSIKHLYDIMNDNKYNINSIYFI